MDNLLNEWLGKDNWIAWCINLDRAKKRKELFSKWAAEIELTFSFWYATDKLTLTEDDYKICDVNTCAGKSSGATACRISHQKCMNYSINNTNKEYILIFEDDAGFKMLKNAGGPSKETEYSNKENLLLFLNDCKQHNWDQIWLGYHIPDPKGPQISNYVRRCPYTLCTHAMMFKKDSLIKLYDTLLNTRKTEPIDSITSDFMKSHITLGPLDTIICQIDTESCIWS
jgi:hypothetical protein